MTKQEQRKRIATVFDKISKDFSLAEACDQLLEEGVEMKLLFRKAKDFFAPWIEDYYYNPKGARRFMAAMQPFWERGFSQEATLDGIGEYIGDVSFYFFLYKRGPQYGLRFDKVEIGKRLLIDFTEYVHTHFDMLIRGFELDSDDVLEIITDPTVVGVIGIKPSHYETILEDCLDSDYFEYEIDDIAERYLDIIGYATKPIWLVEIVGIFLDNGASVIDVDDFAENVLKLKETEGVNWTSSDQYFYENLLEEHEADQRLIEALMAEDDR